jgi:Ca-activated chloride channel family protein
VTLLSPERLWLLVVVGLLAVVYAWRATRRSRFAVALPGLDLLADLVPRHRVWTRHVPAVLLLATMVLLTVGFARPQGDVSVPRERATILLALDTSISMEATDVSPTRLDAAKTAAVQFLQRLPARFNVGLVSFNGGASLVEPPTQDHQRVEAAVAGLELGSGTAIGEAVFASLDALTQLPPTDDGLPAPPTRIVLLSDGTNTVGRSVAAAIDAANAAAVPVSTIAFGTDDGVVTIQGERVPVAVDTETLEQLASSTGGTAYAAGSGDALSAVYTDIGSQVGTTTEQREIGQRFAGLALLLGVAAAGSALVTGTRFP